MQAGCAFPEPHRSASAYDGLRKSAYRSIIREFKTSDTKVDRLNVSQSGIRFVSRCLKHGFIDLSDVEEFLGNAESVLWSPYEVLDLSGDLEQLFSSQLMACLVENLDALRGRMKAQHLWGAFLLATSSDVTRAPNPDCYKKLRMTIMASQGAVVAVKAAAEDLALALPADATAVEKDVKPHWDSTKMELRYKGCLIKEFNQPSMHQMPVLVAFEEEDWPSRIFDPLPPKGVLNPKRRLRQTVEALNEYHKTPNKMYFKADGTGEGICWCDGPKKPKAKKPRAQKSKA